MMPDELIPVNEDIKTIYLVRDGRDTIVSMAHQQIDIYKSTAPFRQMIMEAIQAADGSYFGGWSNHVNQWLPNTNLLVRFEELIENPIEQVNRVNAIYKLPEQNAEKLPSFADMKFGKPTYGRGKRVAKTEQEELDIVRKSFRRGKSFGWQDELDRELQNYFWAYHRHAMESLGYSREGGLIPLNTDLDHEVIGLLGERPQTAKQKHKVLIEANKLLMYQNDGIKRYVIELLKALHPVALNPNGRWQIDVFLNGKIIPLSTFGHTLVKAEDNENSQDDASAQGSIAAMRSVAKAIVPRTMRDMVREPALKAAVKVGLKFSKTAARVSYVKDRLTSGKKIANEKYRLNNGALNQGHDDLVHVPLPQHYEPFLGAVNNNFLVTIHDLTHRLFKDFHTASNVQKAERGIQFFKKHHAEFLCISEATKSDFQAHFSVADELIHTVYEAANNKRFRPTIHKDHNAVLRLRESYNIPHSPFLLTLSTLEPRKNLLNTIKAFDLLLDECPEIDANLVIGGKNGWKSRELLQLKHKKRIIFTGFISEHDLPTLYNEAEALCYVSHYEGFGLPPLEAMSCKTPVIFGDNSSMKELFTGYGLGADSNDVESIKNQMKVLLTDADLKAELGEKSLERTFDFSWRKTAIETLNAYEKAILNRKK